MRDQIIDILWPDLPTEPAQRDFKVALNALNHVLEPARPKSTPPFFVIRSENLYGLNPDAHVILDADIFEQYLEVKRGSSLETASLQNALRLYEEDYLPELRYEDWVIPERERLRSLYMGAAGRLAEALSERGDWDEVIRVFNHTLVRDNCWEPGYRYLMQAYAKKANLAQVQAVYNRCVTALAKELGIEPSAETRSLLRQLVQAKR